MRRIDIVLALLFVGLVVALVFLPDLISNWQSGEEPAPVATVEPAAPMATEEAESVETSPPLDPEEELKRVKGMLMLHQACAQRFDDFASRSQPVLESWKARNADTLAKRDPESDFRIVFGEAEGLKEEATQEAREAERELCERNLENMQTEIEDKPSR